MAALNHGEDRFKRTEMLIDTGTKALRIKFDEWLPHNALQGTLRQYKNDITKKASRPNFATLYPTNGKQMTKTLKHHCLFCQSGYLMNV